MSRRLKLMALGLAVCGVAYSMNVFANACTSRCWQQFEECLASGNGGCAQALRRCEITCGTPLP
jgi:hypothetical protein